MAPCDGRGVPPLWRTGCLDCEQIPTITERPLWFTRRPIQGQRAPQRALVG